MTRRIVLGGSALVASLFVALAMGMGAGVQAAPPQAPDKMKPPPGVDAMRCPVGYQYMTPRGNGSQGCYRRIASNDCERSSTNGKGSLNVDADATGPDRDTCTGSGGSQFSPGCKAPGDIESAPMSVKGPDLCPGDTSKMRPKPSTP
jgi:hypothetical protein